MNTLFPIEPCYPSGFSYVPHFINEAEENKLCKEISNIDLHNFKFQGFEANRKIASFGFDYSFEKGRLTKGREIPNPFNFLISKVSKLLELKPEEFTELLITEYPPGSVINWHRDAPPFDIIVGISLLNDCTFRLRPFDKSKQGRASVISIRLEKRSLYIVKGEARESWQHSISSVNATRLSITLRTLRAGFIGSVGI